MKEVSSIAVVIVCFQFYINHYFVVVVVVVIVVVVVVVRCALCVVRCALCVVRCALCVAVRCALFTPEFRAKPARRPCSRYVVIIISLLRFKSPSCLAKTSCKVNLDTFLICTGALSLACFR